MDVAPHSHRHSVVANAVFAEMGVLSRLKAMAGLVFESGEGSSCNRRRGCQCTNHTLATIQRDLINFNRMELVITFVHYLEVFCCVASEDCFGKTLFKFQIFCKSVHCVVKKILF